MANKNSWDNSYKSTDNRARPWEKGEADKYLRQLIENKLINGKKVLDTCSGLGTQSIYLAQNGYEVSAIEFSSTAVNNAKERAKVADVEIDFREGVVQQLPFEDKFFDFIFDRGCMHHQYDEELVKYLQETKRVLKSHGKMLIIAFTRRFSTQEITSLFSEDFNILNHQIFSEIAADNVKREFHSIFIEKK